MSIIQNKDIYDPLQGDPFKTINEMLDVLDKKIQSTVKNMVSFEKAIKGTNTAGGGAEAKQLIINTEKLGNETKKLNELHNVSYGKILKIRGMGGNTLKELKNVMSLHHFQLNESKR
jgi:hypothetical protein